MGKWMQKGGMAALTHWREGGWFSGVVSGRAFSGCRIKQPRPFSSIHVIKKQFFPVFYLGIKSVTASASSAA
ncbi:MAG: hypothetical protein R2861_13590 [Desulfobacterales bacterium]